MLFTLFGEGHKVESCLYCFKFTRQTKRNRAVRLQHSLLQLALTPMESSACPTTADKVGTESVSTPVKKSQDTIDHPPVSVAEVTNPETVPPLHYLTMRCQRCLQGIISLHSGIGVLGGAFHPERGNRLTIKP